MSAIRKLVEVFIAGSIFNVWVLRYDQPTAYRGGSARNMKQEFAAYGLSPTVMYLVGGSKVALAVCLILGIWLPVLVRPAALLMAVLMAGAITMHVKIKDEPKKSVPASVMLALSAFLAVGPD